jgi:uncharacterized protein YhaN
MEVILARELLRLAIEQVRRDWQDPLIARASDVFAATTNGAFDRIGCEVDDGQPIVVGRRAGGRTVGISSMSDGTRDQLFLAFRLASLEQYCAAAEPLPFIADDLLVNFDDDRTQATLELLAELGKTTQVLLFTHHRVVRDAAARLVAGERACVVDLSTTA